jgi:hypothetical protein
VPILAELKRMTTSPRKTTRTLIEDLLDFVNRLEPLGQAADGAPPVRNQNSADSPLEEIGFEPSVPFGIGASSRGRSRRDGAPPNGNSSYVGPRVRIRLLQRRVQRTSETDRHHGLLERFDRVS